jgi:hypothetical protein
MSLAFCLRSILASSALALLPATALAAAPDVKCAVVGAWSAPSPQVVLLRAEVGPAETSASHSLGGKLLGDIEGGELAGELVPLAQDALAPLKPLLPLRYELAGAYSRGIDGQLYFAADVLLDLRQIGLAGIVKVGECSGVVAVIPIEPGTTAVGVGPGELRTASLGQLGGSIPKARVSVKPRRPIARGGIFLASLRLFE